MFSHKGYNFLSFTISIAIRRIANKCFKVNTTPTDVGQFPVFVLSHISLHGFFLSHTTHVVKFEFQEYAYQQHRIVSCHNYVYHEPVHRPCNYVAFTLTYSLRTLKNPPLLFSVWRPRLLDIPCLLQLASFPALLIQNLLSKTSPLSLCNCFFFVLCDVMTRTV